MLTRYPATDESSKSLLRELLLEQQDLSAVEVFSRWHEGSTRQPPAIDEHPEATLSVTTHRQATHYQRLLPAGLPAAGQQYAFSVDLDRCSGCKACVVACHNLNGLQPEETWRRVGMHVDPRGSDAAVQHVTSACHHCEQPGCMDGCPVLAYEKDPITGIVRHLDDQCFGCQYCTMMCPYEVPQYSDSLGIVRKCDMCTQRLAVGEAPACVQACPNEAIRIEIVDRQSDRRDLPLPSSSFGFGTGLIESAPPADWTRPTTRYSSSWRGGHAAIDAQIDHPQHAHIPLFSMLVLSQWAAGMFVGLAAIALQNVDATRATAFVTATVWAAVVGVGGIHLAVLHLGRPHLFYRAILGWRRSWLSREALAFGLVMAAWVFAAAVYASAWWEAVSPAVIFKLFEAGRSSSTAIAAAASAGLLGVFCSGMIYVATRRHLWSSSRTFSQFGGTVATAACVTAAMVSNRTGQPSVASPLFLAAVAVSAVSLWPLWQSLIAGFAATPADLSSGQAYRKKMLVHRQGRLLHRAFKASVSGLIASHAVAMVAAIASFSVQLPPLFSSMTQLTILALLVIGQLLARHLYFAAIVNHRMPGGGL